MATIGITRGMVLVMTLLVSMLSNGAMAQSGCNSALLSMASCLSYVTGNSTSPSSTCCSQLANVVQGSPQCLCSVLNGGVLPPIGIPINQTLAQSLPGACNVQTPPLSQCKAATAPTPSAFSPTSSPAPSPASSSAGSTTETPEPATNPPASTTPSATTAPAATGTGSKTVPSTPAASGGSALKASANLLASVFLIAALCGSTMTKF